MRILYVGCFLPNLRIIPGVERSKFNVLLLSSLVVVSKLHLSFCCEAAKFMWREQALRFYIPKKGQSKNALIFAEMVWLAKD